jgi:xylose isomerase
LKKSDYKKIRKNRYASFDKGKGKQFEKGDLSLNDLSELALKYGEPEQISGKQELLENIINNHI